MDTVYLKYCKVFFVLDKLEQKYKDDTIIMPPVPKPTKPKKTEAEKALEMKEYKKQYYLENKQKYVDRNKQYRLEKKNKE